MPRQSGTGHSNLRFPAFITLAMTVTRCSQCPGTPLILAAVIDGLDRHLDPLPLSLEGLTAAASTGRWVAVVSPFTTLAHRAKPGHWWLAPPGGRPPTLLAEHAHGLEPLPYDPALAQHLLARFLPDVAQADPDAPPPF
jgi:hypothetical protein